MTDAGTGGSNDAGQQGNQQGTPNGAGNAGNGAAGQGSSGEQDKVQKAIDAVVARERARADKALSDATAQIEALRQQIEALSGKQKPADDDPAFREKIEAARKPLEEQLASERTERQAIEQRTILSEIKAQASDSIDPEEVATQLRPFVRVTRSGEFEVVDKDGKPRYGASGPMTIAELKAELYAKKSYLQKAQSRSGAGFEGARSNGTHDASTLAERLYPTMSKQR